MFLKNLFTAQHIAILGAARSGLAAAKLLKSKGFRVIVSELQKAQAKKPEVEFLQQLDIEHEFGGHTEKALAAELIVASPGISPNSDILARAKAKNIPVLSEIEVAFRFCPGPVIAITGTNGKSTTTALVGEMFKKGRRKHVVAGNIGHPFSAAVQEMDAETTAIVEVSSFQLEAIEKFCPHIAVLLNITPDHLDRHGCFEDYQRVKARICENQTESDVAVYNADNAPVCQALQQAAPKSRLFPFSTEQDLQTGCFSDRGAIKVRLDAPAQVVAQEQEIALPGRHNRANVLAAISAATLSGISIKNIAQAFQGFRGLEHRLEFVRDAGGVKFINDSKATNYEALFHALHSFQQPLLLIAGGQDKGEDFSKLERLIRKKVKKLILIGETANKIADGDQSGVPKTKASNLSQAVSQAFAAAKPGEIVLLSPGCASFDMFENFEDRGRQFKALVHSLPDK
ncbi:MAG: UDP-N-acetylmuramoyl-L-alanine--D-glutamate ligase [bacterium]